MTNSLKIEAKTKAAKIRDLLGYSQEPISDIFNLIESLGILLIKKPLNDSEISAFFMHYKKNYLFLINSSHTLGRQHFSAAHELYHYYYDKELTGNVCSAFKFKNQINKREKLADYFAVHFLMPENGVLKYFDMIGKDVINIKDVIKAQNYFKVSYKAMLVRLKVLELIDNEQYQSMNDVYLKSQFAKFGFNKDLIRSTNETYLPQKYIEVLTDNFENNKITLNAYIEYLNDIGLSKEDIDFSQEEADDVIEETSFDY
ncbi:MAG: ImmA/IrrE family metallo-endopeptidase [Candidatus Woesearchaeota archaeon]